MDEDDPTQHLSVRMIAQLKLEPAGNAIDEYLRTHPAANAQVQEVGIDIEQMTMNIWWVGEVLDPETDAAFQAMTRLTGAPIKIIPVKLSGADIQTAAEQILAEQKDARSVGHDADTLVVRVTGSVTGRAETFTIAGKTVPLRYEAADLEELATPQNDSNP